MVAWLAACEHTGEAPAPPASPPPAELAGQVLALELRLESLRALSQAEAGRSHGEKSLNALQEQLALTATLLLQDDGQPDDDHRAAAEVGLNTAGLYADLVGTDLIASAERVRSVARSHCNRGLEALKPIRFGMAVDWRWPLAHRLDAWEGIAAARRHRDQVNLVSPTASVLKAGVAAANTTSAAISLTKLVALGRPALAALIAWLQGGGFEGASLELVGAGSGLGIQVVAGARVLVLSDEAVIALVETGQVAANALALLFMARGHLHHICTDKNYVSDSQGGPWSPKFKPILDGAKIGFDDPENLVEVEGHQGPHPEGYHREVFRSLQEATKRLAPGTVAYREAVIRTLRALAEQIQKPGTPLNQLVTGAAR
ncbi:MAG TPA: AHH domain-containing protein [Myxococcaceae bacterium]|nr:AHH domain-containing protein [Myxococcaceae bacterium]